MKIEDIRECFYQPGKPGIIDIIHPDTGRGMYGKQTLDECRAEYPGAVVGDFNEVVDQQAAYWRKPPVEITEELFTEMLNCLPPMGWSWDDDFESFKMTELDSGIITGIYARRGSRYFELHDSRFLKRAEIRALVDNAFPGEAS